MTDTKPDHTEAIRVLGDQVAALDVYYGDPDNIPTLEEKLAKAKAREAERVAKRAVLIASIQALENDMGGTA